MATQLKQCYYTFLIASMMLLYMDKMTTTGGAPVSSVGPAKQPAGPNIQPSLGPASPKPPASEPSKAPPGPAVPPTVPKPNNPQAGPKSKSGSSGGGGLNGGQKAGIVIGVLIGAGLLGFGGMVYKKRRYNLARGRFGYAARTSVL